MIPYFGKFLLDSGAFTMFSDKKKAQGLVWEEYVDKYADFIVRNNVEHFFELDIDKLVGYDKVLQLRNRLEKRPSGPASQSGTSSGARTSFWRWSINTSMSP